MCRVIAGYDKSSSVFGKFKECKIRCILQKHCFVLEIVVGRRGCGY
jgi:hypothetical protein